MSVLAKPKSASDELYEVMLEVEKRVREKVAEWKELRAAVREAAGAWPPDRPMPAALREAAGKYGEKHGVAR